MVIIGMMSGTSLDGVDLAACRFKSTDGAFSFEILAAETIDYSTEWKDKLNYLPFANAEEMVRTDWALGNYFGTLAKEFIRKNQLNSHLVASHGHTVFHNPSEGYTHQIGRGPAIVAQTGLPVVNDFRSLDIALGGQGAPLVPIADFFLFKKYDACLNMGGIANISFQDDEKRIAFDIGPCNMLLNYLASQEGQLFDDKGAMAKSGKTLVKAVRELDAWDYYKKPAPKSMGREQIESSILPLFDSWDMNTADKLSTATEHIAGQINRAARQIAVRKGKENISVLITGGGAYNETLLKHLRAEGAGQVDWVVPDFKLVDFKEALAFAFLGYLRMHGKTNVWSDVTGASKDSTGGAIYGPVLPNTVS